MRDAQFDFSTPQGRLFLSIISAINQYYLDLIKLHTSKSKRERARKGLYNFSIAPYGYRLTGDPQAAPAIDENEAPAVHLAFETYATGNYSFQGTAERLNDAGYRTRDGKCFSKDTIDDMLRNRFYMGKVVYGGTTEIEGADKEFSGLHDPIVSSELFEACERVRQKRHGAARSYNPQFNVYLLNAISVCSLCGRSLRAQATKTNRYYREMSRARGFIDCPNTQTGIIAAGVEAQIEAIFRHLRLPPDWQQEIEDLLDRDSEVQTLQNRRARLKAEKRRLRKAYIKGQYEDDEEEHDQEFSRIQRELDSLPSNDIAAIGNAAAVLENLALVWDEADMTTKRDLLRLVLRQVEIDVQQGRIISLTPYPAFYPLFRQSGHLREREAGRFIPIWPPNLAKQEGPDTVLAPLTELQQLDPLASIAWPFVMKAPSSPASQRITPVLSDFLKMRRRIDRPAHQLVEISYPAYPALRLDERKWPYLKLLSLPRIQNVLAQFPSGSVSFLYTPLLLQDVPTLEPWLEQAEQVLEPGGQWVLIEVMSSSMPGHWLYHFFPEAWDLEKQRRQSPSMIYQLLQLHNFSVKLLQRTWYQAISYEAALTVGNQRSTSAILRNLTDESYERGMQRLQTEALEKGEKSLLASHICLAEIIAQRPV